MNDVGPESEFIKNLFNSISGTYDKANDVITLGMAHDWRKKLVEWSGVCTGQRVLDCATGTGDLAFEFKKAVGETGRVTGIDFSSGMLEVAPRKAQKMNLKVDFELGDVLALEFHNDSFDVTSIAYGIRNVEDPGLALTEMARVTKSGGVVMVLETGEVINPVLRSAIRFYFERLVPKLGGWVSGQPEAYEYLQHSSGKFPSGEAFLNLMRSIEKFSSVEYISIMGGASFIYKGVVN